MYLCLCLQKVLLLLLLLLLRFSHAKWHQGVLAAAAQQYGLPSTSRNQRSGAAALAAHDWPTVRRCPTHALVPHQLNWAERYLVSPPVLGWIFFVAVAGGPTTSGMSGPGQTIARLMGTMTPPSSLVSAYRLMTIL